MLVSIKTVHTIHTLHALFAHKTKKQNQLIYSDGDCDSKRAIKISNLISIGDLWLLSIYNCWCHFCRSYTKFYMIYWNRLMNAQLLNVLYSSFGFDLIGHTYTTFYEWQTFLANQEGQIWRRLSYKNTWSSKFFGLKWMGPCPCIYDPFLLRSLEP